MRSSHSRIRPRSGSVRAAAWGRAARKVVPVDCRGLEGMTQHLPVVLREDGRAEAAPTGNSGDFIGLLKSDGFVTLPPRGEHVGQPAAVPFTPWL